MFQVFNPLNTLLMDKTEIIKTMYFDLISELGIIPTSIDIYKATNLIEKYSGESDLDFIRIAYKELAELEHLETLNMRYRLAKIDKSVNVMKIIMIISLISGLIAGLVTFHNVLKIY
jgi:hypothetical protein